MIDNVVPSPTKRNRVERRNGLKPPGGVRVIGSLPFGAMARMRASQIAAVNAPGPDGAMFRDDALHIERDIARSAEFRPQATAEPQPHNLTKRSMLALEIEGR